MKTMEFTVVVTQRIRCNNDFISELLTRTPSVQNYNFSNPSKFDHSYYSKKLCKIVKFKAFFEEFLLLKQANRRSDICMNFLNKMSAQT